MVKARLSTLLSARDVLEPKTPHSISKLVPFLARALKQGTAVSYCKMSQD